MDLQTDTASPVAGKVHGPQDMVITTWTCVSSVCCSVFLGGNHFQPLVEAASWLFFGGQRLSDGSCADIKHGLCVNV